MPKTVLLSKVARKQLDALPEDKKKRIKETLHFLGEQKPERRKGKSRMLDIKNLKGVRGREDLFRLRIGDYRVVYFEDSDCLKVIQILHREKGYKRL